MMALTVNVTDICQQTETKLLNNNTVTCAVAFPNAYLTLDDRARTSKIKWLEELGLLGTGSMLSLVSKVAG